MTWNGLGAGEVQPCHCSAPHQQWQLLGKGHHGLGYCLSDHKRLQGHGQDNEEAAQGQKVCLDNLVVKRVQEKCRRNLARSIRQLANEESLSMTTMWWLVWHNLGLFPYKKHRCQLLSEATKVKHLLHSHKILWQLSSDTAPPVLWTDEKLFTIWAIHNAQNDRVLARSKDNILVEMHSAFRRQNHAICDGVGRCDDGWAKDAPALHQAGHEGGPGSVLGFSVRSGGTLGWLWVQKCSSGVSAVWSAIAHRSSCARVLQGHVLGFLAQGDVVAFLPRPQPDGLQNLVHSGEEGMLQVPAECGHSQTVIGQGMGLHHWQWCVPALPLCAKDSRLSWRPKEDTAKISCVMLFVILWLMLNYYIHLWKLYMGCNLYFKMLFSIFVKQAVLTIQVILSLSMQPIERLNCALQIILMPLPMEHGVVTNHSVQAAVLKRNCSTMKTILSAVQLNIPSISVNCIVNQVRSLSEVEKFSCSSSSFQPSPMEHWSKEVVNVTLSYMRAITLIIGHVNLHPAIPVHSTSHENHAHSQVSKANWAKGHEGILCLHSQWVFSSDILSHLPK